MRPPMIELRSSPLRAPPPWSRWRSSPRRRAHMRQKGSKVSGLFCRARVLRLALRRSAAAAPPPSSSSSSSSAVVPSGRSRSNFDHIASAGPASPRSAASKTAKAARSCGSVACSRSGRPSTGSSATVATVA
eukprot:scaffold96783_cov75-Phaeocystis_antarctica.AAC.3